MILAQWLLWKMCVSWNVYCRTQSRRTLHRFYERTQMSWHPLDEYDSQELRSVMLTSEKIKVHRWIKYKSNFLISVVPTSWNLRIGLRRRLKDKNDAVAERLVKNIHKRKETDTIVFFFSSISEWIFFRRILNQFGGKKICCRFRREYAYDE